MLFVVVDSADISPLSSLTINELYERGESLARNDVPDINAGNYCYFIKLKSHTATVVRAHARVYV